MHLQQNTFKINEAKEEILPQCFQLLASVIMLLFTESFHVFAKMFSNSSAADLLYMGKDLEVCERKEKKILKYL